MIEEKSMGAVEKTEKVKQTLKKIGESFFYTRYTIVAIAGIVLVAVGIYLLYPLLPKTAKPQLKVNI